jgi:hypothetical protein
MPVYLGPIDGSSACLLCVHMRVSNMKETPKRRTTDTSSLNEISMDQLAEWVGVSGGDAQSTELARGPPELVQHFVYRGSSHRRKSAACPKFDMVWLYRLTIPVGRRGVISLFK